MRRIITEDREIAYGFFDGYQEAQEFADSHNGEITLFKKRTGDKRWKNNGSHWGPIKIDKDTFGDEYNFITYDDTADEVYSEYVKPHLNEFNSIDELSEFVDEWQEIIDDMMEMEEDEAFLLENNNGKYKRIDTIKIEGTLSECDGVESLIGVIVQEEIEDGE